MATPDFVLKVDGVSIPTPSTFTYGLQDISASDAGRSQDGAMHTMKLKDSSGNLVQKVTLELVWQNPSPEDTSTVLQAFNKDTFSVTYIDALTNSVKTKTFYVGDRSAPMRSWFIETPVGKRYSEVSFNIIEV